MTNFLTGYKTYIVALLTGAAGVFSLLEGDEKYGLLFVFLAAGLAALRDALNKKK